jgi:23S rRNA (cytosine1962-C5)-methyltransferase
MGTVSGFKISKRFAMHKIIVNGKGEKSLQRRHPWIFSGAVQDVDGHPETGETVAVHALDGRWLAWGAFSPHSQIRVRIWSFDPGESIDGLFFKRRLEAALALRRRLPGYADSTARRWVNTESDGLPGLIVDQYGDYLVCQFLSAGVERFKDAIVSQLRSLIPAKGVYERSDVDVRDKEGLRPQCGPLWGGEPPARVRVRLGALSMWVDIRVGHKTGAYLDQAANQALIQAYSKDAQVLNCFSYTGGFGLWALRGGADRVTQIDASQAVLDLSRDNVMLNSLDDHRIEHVNGNVFELLRQYRDARRIFDLIVLDPPKFVASKAQLDKGARGYKDINLLALKLLRPGGILFTFSCSGLVPAMLFQKIVADAAQDAGRRVAVLGILHQAADHPVALNFPEAHYLKGLVCMAE